MDSEAQTRALADSIGSLFNPKDLLDSFGLLGVWAIIFAETGLLVGFVFPGDSLLFLAGLAASSAAQEMVGTHLSLAALLLVTPVCAIAGAQLGHFLGARYGRRMFDRPNSRIFRPEYVERTEYYFNRFGPAKAVVLARFTPVVRTFLNPMAGVLEMPAKRFFLWNVVGGVIWTDGILLAGYFLANKIKNVIPPDKLDTYLLPAILLIVLISLTPIFIEVARNRRTRRLGATATPDPAAPDPAAPAAPTTTGSGGAHRATGAPGERPVVVPDPDNPQQPATRRRT